MGSWRAYASLIPTQPGYAANVLIIGGQFRRAALQRGAADSAAAHLELAADVDPLPNAAGGLPVVLSLAGVLAVLENPFHAFWGWTAPAQNGYGSAGVRPGDGCAGPDEGPAVGAGPLWEGTPVR